MLEALNFESWLESVRAKRRSTSPDIQEARKLPTVLRSGKIHVVYQPIVHLQSEQVFAYEALVRSSSPQWTTPPRLFEEAVRTRCCGILGRAIRELAVQGCSHMPLFLNIHPSEFDESWLVQPDDPIFTHSEAVYLEITESVPLTHFTFCHSVLREIRSKGIMLAVDDLGAGYSNLKYIADLKPEVVKLDRNLVADMDGNSRLKLLVRHLVNLCEDLNAKVIAEGIEKESEAEAAREVGVHYGQGFLFARPDYPPPQLTSGHTASGRVRSS